MAHPDVENWLAGHNLPAGDPLSRLLLATQLGHDVPEAVLKHWARDVVLARRVADQSEPALITQARNHGWSWADIAERLGLPSAEAAEQRRAVLEAELDRTHPANIPDAYRG
ncbi:hypothetical protein [Amycolatopsis sp. NPDC051903]|uniref:hypothetical protein n=1 Tax=Amycolatopsis sp. NPDC051903 TaxID=3363936 RepID=UPI0037B09335